MIYIGGRGGGVWPWGFKLEYAGMLEWRGQYFVLGETAILRDGAHDGLHDIRSVGSNVDTEASCWALNAIEHFVFLSLE